MLFYRRHVHSRVLLRKTCRASVLSTLLLVIIGSLSMSVVDAAFHSSSGGCLLSSSPLSVFHTHPKSMAITTGPKRKRSHLPLARSEQRYQSFHTTCQLGHYLYNSPQSNDYYVSNNRQVPFFFFRRVPFFNQRKRRISSSAVQKMQANNGILEPATTTTTRSKRTTAVYALILVNLAVFFIDKVLRNPLIRKQLYLYHFRWKWWQPLTSSFCHGDRNHLSNNLFLLLLFGRSVEDDLGWGGLLFSYAFCGIASSLVSIVLLSKNTVSIGASGAVFGLFAVSTLSKFSLRELVFDWRKLVEVAVLGEFVFRQLTGELATVASGGTAGVNHVAHLSGAAAGALLIYGMRATVNRFEQAERK